jgi:MarR family transcriptional regulator for hemolysin
MPGTHLPPSFVLASISFQIFRTARVLGHAFRELASAHGINRSRGMILMQLSHRPDGMTATELRRMSGVTAASMSKMLTDMEREGLITRLPHPDDARSMLVRLTEQATERVKVFPAFMEEIEERAFAGFSEDEFQQLRDLLERVRVNIGEQACSEDFPFAHDIKERNDVG